MANTACALIGWKPMNYFPMGSTGRLFLDLYDINQLDNRKSLMTPLTFINRSLYFVLCVYNGMGVQVSVVLLINH